MAEIGLIASIVSVAGAGISLSTTLYSFAETVSTADKRIKDFATEISLTSCVLEELSRNLRNDKQLRVCSQKAIQTTDDIVRECSGVFEEINQAFEKTLRHTKKASAPAKGQKIAVSYIDRLKWPFLQPKMQLLRSNLERLKSTVLLMLNVLMYARKLMIEERAASRSDFEQMQIEILNRSKDDAARQFQRLSFQAAPAKEVPDRVEPSAGREKGGIMTFPDSVPSNPNQLVANIKPVDTIPWADQRALDITEFTRSAPQKVTGMQDEKNPWPQLENYLAWPDSVGNPRQDDSLPDDGLFLERIREIRSILGMIDQAQRDITDARLVAMPHIRPSDTLDTEGLLVLSPGSSQQAFIYHKRGGETRWLKGDGKPWSLTDTHCYYRFRHHHLRVDEGDKIEFLGIAEKWGTRVDAPQKPQSIWSTLASTSTDAVVHQFRGERPQSKHEDLDPNPSLRKRARRKTTTGDDRLPSRGDNRNSPPMADLSNQESHADIDMSGVVYQPPPPSHVSEDWVLQQQLAHDNPSLAAYEMSNLKKDVVNEPKRIPPHHRGGGGGGGGDGSTQTHRRFSEHVREKREEQAFADLKVLAAERDTSLAGKRRKIEVQYSETELTSQNPSRATTDANLRDASPPPAPSVPHPHAASPRGSWNASPARIYHFRRTSPSQLLPASLEARGQSQRTEVQGSSSALAVSKITPAEEEESFAAAFQGSWNASPAGIYHSPRASSPQPLAASPEARGQSQGTEVQGGSSTPAVSKITRAEEEESGHNEEALGPDSTDSPAQSVQAEKLRVRGARIIKKPSALSAFRPSRASTISMSSDQANPPGVKLAFTSLSTSPSFDDYEVNALVTPKPSPAKQHQTSSVVHELLDLWTTMDL